MLGMLEARYYFLSLFTHTHTFVFPKEESLVHSAVTTPERAMIPSHNVDVEQTLAAYTLTCYT